MIYQVPENDYKFINEHILMLDASAQLFGNSICESDLMTHIFDQAGKFAQNVLLPLYVQGEKTGCRLNNQQVVMPEGYQKAYRSFVEAGWNSVSVSPEYGGMGLPTPVSLQVFEIISSANLSFGLCPLLTQGAIHALEKWGSDSQKKIYLSKLVSGQWTGTMNLTEPSAGSDLGLITTKAVKDQQGHYRLYGTKIYITFGDHDLAENIVHLVLARTPDAPEGTKGLSLFLVPKYLSDNEGNLTEKNDVIVAGIEHKLGIHASPTCTMKFGENQGAVGYLIGPEHQGMKAMFTMMNDARLSVAVQGIAVSEIAFQKAYAYATQRVQGKNLVNGQPAKIIQHPDIQRNLVRSKALLFVNRLLIAHTALYSDKAQVGDSHNQERVDFLIPIVKSWITDKALEITSDSLQVFGGLGFIEETGIASHFRDSRILSIYEGTNGIQAIDLVTRKLCKNELGLFRKICTEMIEFASLCLESSDTKIAHIGDHLELAAEDLLQAGEWMYQKWGLLDQGNEALAGAKPFLDLCAITIGGYYAAKSAYYLAHNAHSDIQNRYQDYIDYSLFFAENFLTLSKSLSLSCTRGSTSLGCIENSR